MRRATPVTADILYEYSTLGEIQRVTDAAGNETTMKYDGFGRRTEINNPDTGRTQFTYDSAGNLTRKITAELNAKGKAIRYHYDHNRLVQVDYPFMDDVYYTYGTSGSGYNRAGRVYRVDNGTVSEELYFGKLGETVKSIKTIKDGTVSTSYTTKYTFDNLGRMRTLTYPDGEILTYNYGKGGLLKSAIGETKTGRTVYLENMQYDAFGQRTYVKYGNGAESIYTYEPIMRRLQNLKTTSSDGKTLQNITYEYDNVGNITNRNNNEFNTNDDVSRNSEQSYEYDEMDRLTGSSGKFDYETWNPFWDKRVNTYTSDYTYSNTGKILQKTQENRGLLQETNETVTIAETTYDWSYEYSGAHPNAVTQAGPRTYSYDLNGNMTQMTVSPLTPGGGTTSMTRTLAWDDENRLLKTTDKSGTNENITSYSYDASGMRALKKGKYGTVQYVSDNYTVRNKDLISKHVFAGNTRLVSKTVMQEEKSGKMTATEQGAYYYHADHLGSSSVVTDKEGKFYEQIEYFPYGETWINNKATAEQTSTPYKFTAKEYDEETGLYYYGARYYDAKLSRWVSADPPLARGEYLPTGNKKRDANLPGMGGVFNAINIDAYHYAGDNPVKFVDPDGNAFLLGFDYKGKHVYKYIASSRFVRVSDAACGWIPWVGNWIYDGAAVACDAVRLDYTNRAIMNTAQSGLDILSKVDRIADFGKYGKFISRKIPIINNLLNIYSTGESLFCATDKVELIIDRLGLLCSTDKDLIITIAPYVENRIKQLVDSGDISLKTGYWNTDFDTHVIYSTRKGWDEIQKLKQEIKDFGKIWFETKKQK